MLDMIVWQDESHSTKLRAPCVDAVDDIQHWLDRTNAGDTRGRDELIGHACDRLRRLTRKMLKGYPHLRRWEQTDDVFQHALLRLHHALADVHPESVRQFFGLASLQIRRVLIDLARHHFGAEGPGRHHHSDGCNRVGNEALGVLNDKSDASHEPTTLAAWGEFHEQVEALPDTEREVFSLLWYEGLSQASAASLLGVDVRTIKRRWQSARVRLYNALDGQSPE